jgi:hypothetical protein
VSGTSVCDTLKKKSPEGDFSAVIGVTAFVGVKTAIIIDVIGFIIPDIIVRLTGSGDAITKTLATRESIILALPAVTTNKNRVFTH